MCYVSVTLAAVLKIKQKTREHKLRDHCSHQGMVVMLGIEGSGERKKNAFKYNFHIHQEVNEKENKPNTAFRIIHL